LLFSTPTFLYVFLPAVLALHLVLPRRFRNAGLLLASLVFYAWGEREIVAVMLLSIGANYGFGCRIEALLGGRGDAVGARRVVGYAVAFNLGLLVLFKYTSWLLGVAADAAIALPADLIFDIPAAAWATSLAAQPRRVTRSTICLRV
jgi:alginate O-acetyltransferase complex protein AlgI